MIDTSYTAGFMDKAQFKRIVRNHGSDKVLFGTDNPWHRVKEEKEFIDSIGLEKIELENIYYKNAKRVLNI